jgi:thymidylate synthase ThyX
MLFDTYSKLIPPMTALIEQKFPKEEGISKIAYTAALRAKVLDCIRGLLPASTLTNMGLFGNGRFFEQMLHKLHCNNLAEMQEIGKKSYEELAKTIPSFIRRSQVNHHTHQGFVRFFEGMQTELKLLSKRDEPSNRIMEPGVRMISCDEEAVLKVAAALLFANSNAGLAELYDYCKSLSEEEIARILDTGCNTREHRRHKSPRALEHANFTFEMINDFGVYRDLHRHRMLTQERQLLTCDYGYDLPPDIAGTSIESEYIQAMDRAKEVYEILAKELPEEAQYVVPMGYRIRWYAHINLRALQWLCELRSSPAGHANYRFVAQDLARIVCRKFPQFERFFKFVDYDGYELGRLGQELQKTEKQRL